MKLAIGIILIVFAIFLIIAVLLQQGKNLNLSGAIAGGAETFFGKTKATSIDKKLGKLTTIVAIVFVIIVLISYLMQDTSVLSGYDPNGTVAETSATETTDAAETDVAGVDGVDTSAVETGAAE